MVRKRKNVCEKCEATCCRNLGFQITKPRTVSEIEKVRWYLHFDTVRIYTRHYRWHLLIEGKCRYLSKKNLCTIYDQRPQICRDHKSDSCELTGQWYDEMISSPEELDAFIEQTRRR